MSSDIIITVYKNSNKVNDDYPSPQGDFSLVAPASLDPGLNLVMCVIHHLQPPCGKVPNPSSGCVERLSGWMFLHRRLWIGAVLVNGGPSRSIGEAEKGRLSWWSYLACIPLLPRIVTCQSCLCESYVGGKTDSWGQTHNYRVGVPTYLKLPTS